MNIWQEVRKEFPVCNDFIYLNSAGGYPISASAAIQAKQYLVRYLSGNINEPPRSKLTGYQQKILYYTPQEAGYPPAVGVTDRDTPWRVSIIHKKAASNETALTPNPTTLTKNFTDADPSIKGDAITAPPLHPHQSKREEVRQQSLWISTIKKYLLSECHGRTGRQQLLLQEIKFFLAGSNGDHPAAFTDPHDLFASAECPPFGQS
jgi:hypothetical protein